MPRDLSGNYTLPAGNPVVDGTIIDVLWANPTMSDIAVQLNNVLTRDGLLGPITPMYFVDGSAAVPGISFAANHATGIYRVGGGGVGISVAGSAALELTAAAATFSVAPTWAADPASANQLTRKSYVDTLAGTYLPLAGGVVTGATSFQGGVTLGDAPADALTIISNVASIANGLSFTNGNVGIATTPLAWGATTRALEVYGASLAGTNDKLVTYLTQNLFSDGINWRTKVAGEGTIYVSTAGAHLWYTTATVGAGAIATLAQLMQLSALGNLGIGKAAAAGYRLDTEAATLDLRGRATDSASRAAVTLWNDQNVVGRAMYWMYTGSAFPGTAMLGGYSGESGNLFTTGAYPFSLGTNSFARLNISAAGEVGIGLLPNVAYILDMERASVLARLRSTTSTTYTGVRLWNDANSAFRALEMNYAGSAYPGALIGSGPSGEQGTLATTGNFPFSIGTNNTARITISGSGITNFVAGTGTLQIGGAAVIVTYTNNSWAINASYALGHSAGRQADIMQVQLQCLTAEGGYSVGDRVEWYPNRSGYTGGHEPNSDTAAIRINIQNAAVQLPNKSGGAAFGITVANWQLRLVGIWL